MSSSELPAPELTKGLSQWLEGKLPGARRVVVGGIEQPKAGFSNETVFFEARIESDEGEAERALVLRRGGEGEAIYPLQTSAVGSSVELQHRVMTALAGAGVSLVAPMVGWEPRDEALGRPFFVMDFVPGRVLPDFPSYTTEGFFAQQASAPVRLRYVESGLAAMAAIHRVDWAKAGLAWLDRTSGKAPRMESQLSLWRSYLAAIPGCRDHELLATSLGWLEARRPAEFDVSLSWGDARIQNMIFADDGRCRSVMDWEGAAILPPEVDLAWWLGVDHFVHEFSGVERLPGELTNPEQVAYYEARLGRPARDLAYYRVFAAFRTVALMISTYERLASMGVSDAGTAADNPYEGLLREALEAA